MDAIEKKAYMARWRAENKDKIRACALRQAEKRKNNPAYREYIRGLRARIKDRPHNLEHKRAGSRNYRARHPERIRAGHAVLTALRSGRLVRPECCDGCKRPDPKRADGRSGIHAHHHDYGKPLEVEWLCRACHQERHGG